MTQIGPQKV